MSGRLENDSFKLLELKLNLEGNMADKIQNAYETSKNIYDDVLTQRNIFSKLYIKLFWSGTDDNDIARKVLSYVPDDFSGNLLDVPVGTAVFTENKWNSLKNAPIVILDEATAFTDPENENKIQKSIEELTKGKTLLVIAHRLSTITDADKIVVLKNGCIEGAGTQEELLQNCQLYQRMWQAHVGARHWAVGSQKEGEDSCLAL